MVRSHRKHINRIDPEAALSMYVEGNFSKSQYNTIKRYTGRVVPNYNVIEEVKKKVYPDCIEEVGEDFTQVRLQSLLDKTTKNCLVY